MELGVALDDELRSLVESPLEQLYLVDYDLLDRWHHVADGVSLCCFVLVLRVDPLGLRCILPHLIT